MQQKIEEWSDEDDECFTVCDLGDVYRQHLRWKTHLPRVEPFYAVKCNDDPRVLKLLVSLGIGFDCASKFEMQPLLEQHDVHPSRIVFANPCKPVTHIQYAAKHHVSLMTFDNVDELYKIKESYPEAELILRIFTDNSKAYSNVSAKFGAHMESVDGLLMKARELELPVVGVSFHIGTGCMDASAFTDALSSARSVFDQAASMGHNMTILDLGGGFPGVGLEGQTTFENVANVLREQLDALFPPHIRVIAEPGRFYVSTAFTTCTRIMAKRSTMTSQKQKHIMYYTLDGVFGLFGGVPAKNLSPVAKVMTRNGKLIQTQDMIALEYEPKYECSIWGPTCTPYDCITLDAKLPDLQVGDWLYWPNMGAYTYAIASHGFSGFTTPSIIYIDTSNVL
ncbi:hypothetical protein K492DRAFT_136290 [Lichtheimia hyalospora FSU 10163]|nr:hypothetical protein K492DRAFT_136290 [Lichtheimia hyalospora FSU 10163]